MADSSFLRRPEESFSAVASGLSARVLLGWMGREQALKFLMEDCLFSTPLTIGGAEETWASFKAIVENLHFEEPLPMRKLPLSAADMKAARKFRTKHPDVHHVVDFVRLNPMDLVVHQLWVSTDISDGYRDRVTPDKWLRTALFDPPSNSRLTSRREGGTILFDLPHAEFFLDGPMPPYEQMRVSEADGFITVTFHADRALLLRGYHRTFAFARYALEAVNAPHGVLFGLTNQLAAIGSEADDVRRMMEEPRPPRMADWFDDRLFLPVTLRRRRYRMRIHYEVVQVDDEETQTAAEQSPVTAAPEHRTSKSPDDPSPNMLGNVHGIYDAALRHHRAGRIDDAAALYQRILFLRPDHAAAHSNLGVALFLQNRIDEAMEHCERALVLDPDDASASITIGAVLARQGRMDEAVARYRRVLAVNPDHSDAHNGLGIILMFQGNFDEAMAHYGRAIAIRPDYPEAHYNRAEIKTFHRGDPDLAALETLAAQADLPENGAPFIHFALAKALEDSGDYERSFEHLRKGNDLKRRQINYDEASAAEVFQRISAAFDSDLFHRLRGKGDASPAPIFVLGMPRSGSSLIEQILASHPKIHGAGELADLEIAARTVLNGGDRPAPFPECVPALDGDILRRIGQSYLARLLALAKANVRIVDKMPGNFLNIGLIRLALPNAKIIHAMRDPIDTCLSCYSRLFTSGQPFTYDLAELGRYYGRYFALMNHWRSVLPPSVMLDISYEDVVDDLEGQARRLIDYCGLPWDDRCLSFHKTSRPVKTASAVQVRKPVYRSSLQRWRHYKAGLAPLLHELGTSSPAAHPSNYRELHHFATNLKMHG
jgi:tetratricopeptide (TPR) repeat protein